MSHLATDRILLSITGSRTADWRSKLSELSRRGVTAAALFLEHFGPRDRRLIYAALEKTPIKTIPLVHLRRGMRHWEVKLLFEKYRTRCFTIHEDFFPLSVEWRGYHRYLYLEMTTDDWVAPAVRVEKIGGFCVDLAHFEKQRTADTAEFHYVWSRRAIRRLFVCNHISGYDAKLNTDVHNPTSATQFRYLKELPRFLLGRVMAMEVNNPISDQVRFRQQIRRYLNEK